MFNMQNDYNQFLETKKKTFISSGFEIDENDLNDNLFDFQRFTVKTALSKGRFAIFADCGLGKTLMQLAWCDALWNWKELKTLILAPLAVVEQTKEEAIKFGIDLNSFDITNYDQLKNIDVSQYGGVVLDESSILKGKDGKLSDLILESFKNTPYKLACTATPSPNDHMELGQHSEFVGAMSYLEMLAMFFVHDGGETSKWRLRKHAKDAFWKYVSTWSIAIDNPRTLGFECDGYDLPEIEYIEHIIEVENETNTLFGDVAVSATDLHKDLNRSFDSRINKTIEIVNSNNDQWLIWGLKNDETDILNKKIEESINLQGNDSLDRKQIVPLWFTNDKNTCKCQDQNITQNITQKTKNQSLKDHVKDKKKEDCQIQNSEVKGLNIQKNIIAKTNQNSTLELLNKTKKETELEERNTPPIKSIESQLNIDQESTERIIQNQELVMTSKGSTESTFQNTIECLNLKTEDAQFVEKNHHSSMLNKDYMLTIATKQEKSEDYYASTVIKELENSMIQKHFSKVQLCTCCGKYKKKILITKTSIMSFGINAQSCNQMIFMSYDFKFEAFYQAVRRCYRFGQKRKVTVHILIPESQINVRQTILEKEKQHKERIQEMSKYSAQNDYKANKSNFMIKNKEIKTENYHLINGDCVQETSKLPDNCADIVVFSPPFAELYVYSDKEEDMGNVTDYKQFEEHFKFLIPQLKRTLKPGRICAIHCMDLPIQKGKEGYIGLRDFSGMITEWFQEHGFIYHSRVTIWKNPVTEMQRTKALGLLHKTIKKDSSMTRVGIPDYVLFFRNEGDNEIPITHQDKDQSQRDYLPVDLWQKYASPVWYDIDYSRTLQYRSGRDGNDEKHICPLQLDTIERILHLYSNEGETVLSPFGGIGSEGFCALKMNRKSISIELKESYFSINAKNHADCIAEKNSILTLF